MPQGTFQVGRDAQAVLIAPNGDRVDLTNITEFEWDPEYQNVTARPLNGPKIERFLPDGHRLRFTIDRANGNNEAIIAQIEAGWWNVGSLDPGTSDQGSAYIYNQEVDGSVTTIAFYGLTLKMTKTGPYKSDSPVKQQIEGYAQRFARL